MVQMDIAIIGTIWEKKNNTSQNVILVVDLLWSGELLDGTEILIFLLWKVDLSLKNQYKIHEIESHLMPSANISFSNKTMQAFILQTRQMSGLREKNHCTRMVCPLARFKPGGKCMGHYGLKNLCEWEKYDTVA